MNRLITKLQQYLFILLGVFIPTSIAITNLIVGLLSLCWILEGNFKTKFEFIKASKWILSIFALIGLYALGMLWGEQHLNAEWQFQRLALLLVFPVFVTLDLKQETLKKSIAAFLVTSVISAIVAIAINCNIILPLYDYFNFITRLGAISAFITYNYHNVILALTSSLCLYILIEKKSKYRHLLFCFFLLYALSIFTEKGRAGQVIFNLSSIFYILYYNNNRKHILRGFTFLLLLLSFQVGVYHSTNVYKDRFDTTSNMIKNNGDTGKEADLRYVFVKESLNKIFEKPLLGHGTGSFGTIFFKEVKTGNDVSRHKTPHNQYLYVWFELGILGLLLLLSIFYHQIRELVKKKDGIHRILLPLSFMFLMLVDSYFFIFILTIAYIYLFTIYSRYQSE